MNVNEFVKGREADWQRLEALINRHKGQGRLSAKDVHELGTLYRAVISDLAMARRDFPNQRVILFLNQLMTRTHSVIYRQDISDLGQLVRYFTERIPSTFRETIPFTLAAFLLFIVPAIVGYRLVDLNPHAADLLGLAEQRATLANHETWTNISVENRPYMSAFIMSNNIRVAILAFGGGMLFGVFTVYILAMNGLIIGAVLGLAVHYNMGASLLTFIVGHGVIELSVIFMAGGTGLQLGWALLNPGQHTRRDALAIVARRAVVLVIAAMPLLIIAGTIEGFISPSDLPAWIHVAVGLGSGLLMYAYLFFVGRRAEPEPQKPVIHLE